MEKIKAALSKSQEKNNLIFIFALAALVIGGGVTVGLIQNSTPNTQPGSQIGQAPSSAGSQANIPPYTVLYGVWSDKHSVVKAYDLETKKNYELAQLPQNIKRIHTILPDTLVYINDTNSNDHGKEIIKYSIASKAQTPLVKADEKYLIDDYLVSPDGNYIAVWEVKLTQGGTQLDGGNSRIYTVNVNDPSVKNLIFDEVADKPIHYPRGITNEGTVITDMFLPNSGPGWAYGMSRSDFTGSSKQDVVSMANGTYGRQPRISYDGNQLAFVGYDGVRGSGTEQVKGVRRAVIHPNTIEILDSKTFSRKRLPNLSGNYVFDDVRFDPGNNYLFLSQIKLKDSGFITDVRVYDLASSTSQTVPNTQGKRGFAMLSGNQVLVGKPIVKGETMGNLGETYQFINSSFEIINIQNSQSEIVPIPYSNMQYIGIYPNSATPSFGTPEAEMSTDALQMHTFVLKPELMIDRVNLQASANVGNRTGVKGLSILAQAAPPPPPPPPPPLETNPTEANPTEAEPTEANPTEAQPTEANPTNPNTSPRPSVNLSDIPKDLPEGIPPMPEIDELTDENIQLLIEWLQNLLGILEQETQN